MRLLFTLFVLLFTQLFLNMAHASPQTRVSADQRKSHVNQAAPEERRKRKTVAAKNSKKTKTAPVTEQKTQDKNSKKKVKSTELVKRKTTTERSAKRRAESKKEKTLKTTRAESKTERHSKTRTLAKNSTEKAGKKEAYGRHRKGKKFEEDSKPITLSATHKKRYQHAQQTAMTKLMHQVGKPYRWGGTSPNTGFDCSGLVYYAYKDLIRIKMPRTANEMYHLRDAAPVKRGELESGDLVFFRINNRGAADHVGVYVGNGKFIQSPRTGEDIKITSLGDDYWQDHYVGARRVMTPKTIR